jgi:hypothetical protein
MAWYLVPLIVGVVFAIPQVIGLVVVALAPSRSEQVCQVLREGSRVGCLIAALRLPGSQSCCCTTDSPGSPASRRES